MKTLIIKVPDDFDTQQLTLLCPTIKISPLKNVHGVRLRELGIVNAQISVTDNEVRVWLCNPELGCSVFRVKAQGKVYGSDDGVVILPKEV